MRILLTGSTGQVGWELARSLLPLGEIIPVDRTQLDLGNATAIRTLIKKNNPDVIVNAAAYTNVDKAEDEEELATLINGVAPGILAEEAERNKALLVHYSTDYVFDGEASTPYTEDELTNPLNAYGRSKLLGEKTIQSTGCDYLIIRTSWVYSARRANFVKTMLRLFKEREELNVVSDQIGSPTWSRSIADTTSHIISQYKTDNIDNNLRSGIYHLTAGGEVSWHGFAEQIKKEACRLSMNSVNKNLHIKAISSEDYPQVANRPKYSVLSINKIVDKFAIKIPEWQVCLKLCVEEIFLNREVVS